MAKYHMKNFFIKLKPLILCAFLVLSFHSEGLAQITTAPIPPSTYTGTTIPFDNADLEAWNSNINCPIEFKCWRSNVALTGGTYDYNMFATLSQDDQVRHGKAGHSLKVKIDNVTFNMGKLAIHREVVPANQIAAGQVYVFSGYVNTQALVGDARLAITLSYTKKEGTYTESEGANGYVVFEKTAPHNTEGWQKLSVEAPMPPQSQVASWNYLKFSMDVNAFPHGEDGIVWFDDLEVKKYETYKDISVSFAPNTTISPDAVTQVPLATYAVGNVYKADGTLDLTGNIIVEIPEGVDLVATQRKRTTLPTPQTVVIENQNYKKYVFNEANITTYSYFDAFLLQTDWAPGQKGKIYLSSQWAGGAHSRQGFELEAVSIPQARQPHELKTTVLSWFSPVLKQLWPGLMPLLKRIGAQGFVLDQTDVRAQDQQAYLQTSETQARALGLDTTARFSPFYDKRLVNLTSSELARTFTGGATKSGTMCKALRAGGYQEFLTIFRETARRGYGWFDFDFEPETEDLFCGGAYEEFISAHPESAGVPKQGLVEPRDTNYDDVYDLSFDKPEYPVSARIYDFHDARWDDFQTDKVAGLWKGVFDATREGLAESGSDKLPVMFAYKLAAGHTYPGQSDFDKIRHLFPMTSNVEAYINYSGIPSRMGHEFRRSLLSVYAIDGENLVINPGFETGTSGALPQGYTANNPAGITWINLQNGTGRVREGLRAIKMTSAGRELSTTLSQLEKGASYVFAVDSFRSRKDMEACLQVRFYAANGNEVADSVSDCGPTMDGRWERLALYETMPADASVAKIILYATGSADHGAVWFDKVFAVRHNLIDNAGFETDSQEGFSSTTQFITTTPALAHNGLRSAILNAGTAQASPTLITDVPIKEHFPYEFSAFVAGPDTPVTLAIEWLDEATHSLGEASEEEFTIGADEGWQQIILTANAPSGTTTARLRINATGDTNVPVYVDDLLFRVDGPYLIPYLTPGA
ncbi:MAG: hypothetical protein ACD_62C00459G0001, partial [uncultured bacterium]